MKKLPTILTLTALLFSITGCSAASSFILGTDITTTEQDFSALQKNFSSKETVVVSEDAGAESVEAAQAENEEDHADPSDYEWQTGDEVQVLLNGDLISADSTDVTIEGSTATITTAGTYVLTGALDDGQVIVDTDDEDAVRLVLNKASISSSTSAPIYIMNAETAVIVLEDGTENAVSDGSSYILEDAESDEPNAAIFSKADLSITGSGSLTVTGNYNDGIASKDGLVIESGYITVNAVDDGIRGKDYIAIHDGTLNVTAGGDGLKSDNEEDAEKGYIAITTGTITVNAGGDAITAETDVLITDGVFDLTSGGGSGVYANASLSAKGIKTGVNLNIDGGTFTINASDDALHSNQTLVINNGVFSLSTSDDAIRADAFVGINDGEITILTAYEGIESTSIVVNGGSIYMATSDDGFNVAGGADLSGITDTNDSFSTAGDYTLHINGGTITMITGGDGLDSNGSIEMTGGYVVVNGPEDNRNSAIDCDGSFTVTGGLLFASGQTSMADAPDATSPQNSVMVNFDSALSAGTAFYIIDTSDDTVIGTVPTKFYQSMVVSSSELVTGGTYEIYIGSVVSDNADEIRAGSTLYANFTISSGLTMFGQASSDGGRHR